MKVCELPAKTGVNAGRPAEGTAAGYYRHRRAGEEACEECLAGVASANREWVGADPERKKARSITIRRWDRANQERRNAAARRRYAADPAKHMEYTRRTRAANPDLSSTVENRRRARKAEALTIPFTVQQLADRMAVWGNRCWMCAGPYEAVDHVIALALGGPHCLSNLRPACRSCNASKGARPYAAVA